MVINGHPTSFRLEPTFWKLLRVVAVECGYSVRGLIEVIALARHPKQNLSSAIRVWVAAYFYGAGASSAGRSDHQASRTAYAGAQLGLQSSSGPTLDESDG
jgi:predicted DNA-binding ribbon-helix-helix protein